MLVRVLTSCTGEKSAHHPERLTLADFQAGPAHVAAREAGLPLTPAVSLYTGQQHLPLVEGVARLREAGHQVDLSILSAGYGLVAEERPLAPYEATYSRMGRAELRQWAREQGVPQASRALLERPADLCLVLLGAPYLRACQFPAEVVPGAPTLCVCAAGAVGLLPVHPLIIPVIHTLTDTRRFRSALVGLKGVVGRLLLEALALDPSWLGRAREPGLLDALAERR